MKRALILSTVLVFAAAGCGERLDNIVGCPGLCPQDPVDIQTVTIEPVVFDTTVRTPVAPGAHLLMLLATRPDTLDTRVVVRFDTLPTHFFSPEAADTLPITEIVEASLRLRISTAEGHIADPTTITAFNVDTAAADTAFSALLPLFRPDRLIGSGTFAAEELDGADSVNVPLFGEALLPILHSTGRLRIGLRVSGPTGVQFHVFSDETGLGALLAFRPSADTAVAPVSFLPQSLSPDNPAELRANLADYMILVQVPPAGLPGDLNVGGLPAQRSYLRFEIPSSIIDSATVVRATLLLTQRPNPAFGPSDTLGIAVNLSLAGRAVTDIARASLLIADPLVTGVDTLRVVPAEGRDHAVDIANFVRVWRSLAAEDTPHAVVLASTRENGSALEARFFSIEASPELRPRLRISFAPRPPLGLP